MAIIVGAFEAKTKLSELLDRVEAGEEIIITRRGKEVARLVASPLPETAKPADSAEAIMAISSKVGVHLRRRGITVSSLDHDALLYDETGLPK